MIPYDQIDARLKALGLDRTWLAEQSGRNRDSIRVALAPNAPPAKRSELLQRALSETIEREELARRSSTLLPERVSIEGSKEEFDAWCRAYKASDADTLEDWAVEALNEAAKAWAKEQRKPVSYRPPLQSVAEEPGQKTRRRK